MNNKEKQQYLADMMLFKTPLFIKEFGRRKAFYRNMPKTLYKYRGFDKYTEEMLEEPYVFLAPVKNLDDPFDCLTDPGVDASKDSIGLDMIDFVIDTVRAITGSNFDVKEVKPIIMSCFVDGKYNCEYALKALAHTNLLTNNEKRTFNDVMLNLDKIVFDLINGKVIENFTKIAIDSGNRIGVCSLSTKRDNKVMWSLYSKQYSGYVIEYEIPNDDNIRFNLSPVIYKRNDDNNYIHILVKFAISIIVRQSSNGYYTNGIGVLNELFCTKDTDWSFQDEWRLIGGASTKCNAFKIKAVYIGFKASETNIKKIKRIAKRKNFKVFLMEPPKGKKKISYKEQ